MKVLARHARRGARRACRRVRRRPVADRARRAVARRADARRAPPRFNMVGRPLARLRQRRRIRTRWRRGGWSAWQAPTPTSARRGSARTSCAAGTSATSSGPATARRDPLPHARPRDASARVLRLEPGRSRAGAPPDDRERAADHPALSLGRRRVDPPRAAAVRDAIHFAVVHHTAGTNNYTAAQSAAIVRGIEIYHVKGNGWNDIGYNFLVDKYGQVFEGRYGGIDKATHRRARAGLQHRLGRHRACSATTAPRAISAAAKASLEQLLAWRLDVAHVDPLSHARPGRRAAIRASPPASPVFLRAISGHRDTDFTDCPGNCALRAAAADREGRRCARRPEDLCAARCAESSAARSASRASSRAPLPWTVTVADSTGAVVAQGRARAAPSTGRGTRRRRRAAEVHVDDRDAPDARSGDRHARRRLGRARRAERRATPSLPRRRRLRRRHDDDRLHAHRAGDA